MMCLVGLSRRLPVIGQINNNDYSLSRYDNFFYFQLQSMSATTCYHNLNMLSMSIDCTFLQVVYTSPPSGEVQMICSRAAVLEGTVQDWCQPFHHRSLYEGINQLAQTNIEYYFVITIYVHHNIQHINKVVLYYDIVV